MLALSLDGMQAPVAITPATGLVSCVYAPAEPVDLRQTLGVLMRGVADPTMRWDASGVWRTMITPLGPATLHLAQRGRSEIRATAWGAGADWAIDGVPQLLGRGDDWSDVDFGSIPALAEVRRRTPGMRLPRTNLVFEAMLPAVLEQKVTGIEAKRAWRMLILRHGSPPPGPAPEGMRVMPSPAEWRRIPSWEWHGAGVGPQRSQTAIRVAEVAASLERTLDYGRGGRDVERCLQSIHGVGVWTCAETTQRSHGDPDAPSVGDYHLAAIVGWALVGKPIDDTRMLELLEPFRGHRQRVVRLILASGARKPARGPRMTINDHRGH